MTREQLIELAKELSALDDLSNRTKDVAILKKEARKYIGRDEDTYSDQEQNQILENYYNQVASKVSSLNASAYDDKLALVAKAKELLNAKNFKNAAAEMNTLFEEFKKAPRCTKEQDDALWAEFKSIKDQFNANRNAYFENVNAQLAERKAKKDELIKEANALLELENIKDAMTKYNELLDAWKKVGFSGKENDDAQWAEFSKVRSELNAKRTAYFNKMQEVYNERIAKKEEIIKKAKLFLANAQFVGKEVAQVKALRNEWKEVGFAGKEKEDELWNSFNSIINKYFEELKNYQD